MAEWDKDPFAKSGDDPFGDDPFAGEKSPGVAPEKPSLFRRGLSAVGGALVDAPQLAYEGVAGTANAFARQMSNAMAVPEYVGGILGGGSPEEAAQFANQRIQKNAHWNPLPPTLGKGSYLAQGIGYGANKLIESGAVSPEDAQAVGDTLAIAGAPGMFRGVRGAGAAAGRAVVDRAKAAFPASDVRAGELLYNTRKAVPMEVDSIAARAGNQELAKQVVGDQRFPETASPNIRRQQLAASRATNSADVRATETATVEAVQTKAAAGLDTAIPREAIDPARLDFLNKKIEAHNAARTAAADMSTKGAREAAVRGVEDTALAELGKLEAAVPKGPGVDRYAAGVKLLDRLRGKGAADADTGVAAVRKVFNKEYEAFDAKPEAVHPSAELAEAIKESADISTETGRVLRGYVDEAKKVESRLGENVIDAEGQDLTQFPENLTLKQFRGIKGEFARAAEIARGVNNRPAAVELDRLSSIARQGELQAVEKLGSEAVKQYSDLSAAYRNVFVRAFREGHGGRMLSQGKEVGGSRLPPANLYPSLMQFKNVHDFIAALGAEKAAQTGKVLTGIGEADLQALGRPEAAAIVRPYVESTLATLYKNAGGGAKGSTAVTKYLQKNAETLNTYGLDFGDLRTASTKYNETIARLTKAKTTTAKEVVEGVIPTTDPTKLGKYVFDSASPPSAYKNLLGVSKDPLWKSSVDTLMIDELKSRMDAGADVFATPKTRAAMEVIWSPAQMKTLKAYHAVVKELSEPPARFKGEGPNATMQEVAMGALQATPPGFSWRYMVKGGVKLLAKMGIKAGDEAMYGFLDDALMDPVKADMIVQAYKGSALAKRQLGEKLAGESRTWKDLAKSSAARVAPAVAGGAVSTAGQRGTQVGSQEAEEVLQ